jgi:antitoxin HigA-1
MMADPPKPGAVLAQYLGGLSLADAAAKIGMGQEHLSNLITGTASIDASLAAKLARALGTSADLWLGLQTAFDACLPSSPLDEKSVRDLNGMFKVPPGVEVSIAQIRRGPLVDDFADWDNMAPVGREFGSLTMSGWPNWTTWRVRRWATC